MRLGPEDHSSVKDAATGSLPATGQIRGEGGRARTGYSFARDVPHGCSRSWNSVNTAQTKPVLLSLATLVGCQCRSRELMLTVRVDVTSQEPGGQQRMLANYDKRSSAFSSAGVEA